MFGLAILAAYLPVLIAFIFVARKLKKALIASPNDAAISARASSAAIVTGTIIATAIALLVPYYALPKRNDLSVFALGMFLTIILPLVVGFFFIVLAKWWRKNAGATRGPIVVNRLGIGAFEGVWFLPVFLVIAFQVGSVIHTIKTGAWSW